MLLSPSGRGGGGISSRWSSRRRPASTGAACGPSGRTHTQQAAPERPFLIDRRSPYPALLRSRLRPVSAGRQAVLWRRRGSGFAVPVFCSYFALSKAIVKIPISTAYAIWEGIGLIGTATVAYFIFNEDLSLLKVLAFMVILSGLIMIKKGTYTVSNK